MPSAIMGTCIDICPIVCEKLRTMPRKDTTIPTVMTSMPTRWMFGVFSRIMTPPTIATTTYMMLPMLPRAGIRTLPVDVGLLGGVEELLVVLDELVLGVLLVVEDLDDLLAVHHLFDEALFVSESRLLRLHEAARQAAELAPSGTP